MTFDIIVVLPKQYRLHDYREIEKVKKEGKFLPSPLFGFLLLEKLSQPVSRFSFIVSTKISKKAVERNRIKRVLSETVRNLLPKIKPGFDGVFLAKKSLIGKKKIEIETEIERVFKKSGIMS